MISTEDVLIPLAELAAPTMRAQHALITRQQAMTHAESRHCVDRLVSKGVWERIDRGLYGPAGVPMTWQRRLMAAVLLTPPRSFVSHRSAAALHGVGGLADPPIEITIPRGRTFRRPWAIVHESTDLHLADIVTIDAIPTSGPLRLAMDLGGVVSPGRFRHSIRELRHGLGVESADLLRTYLRHKRQGRTGGGALRDWLDRYYDISGTPESGAELVVLDAILDAHLPAPVAQHWVNLDGHRYRLDLAYPALRIAVEIDGAQHEDADIGADDEERTRRLEAAGWTVLRIRAKRLATDLPRLLGELRHHLAIPH